MQPRLKLEENYFSNW